MKQTETPHDKLRLRITIHSDIECEGVRLALEIEEGQRILFNGQEVAVKPDGWFTDPCIQTVPLPALKKGENELILEMAFGKKTNTEWCYLLGDFGLEMNDTVPASWYCNCSRERVAKAIVSIGSKDIREMIQDNKPIEVKCHFCNHAYNFDIEDLKEILKAAKR